MARNMAKNALTRFAERLLRLSGDAAKVYENLSPSETKYWEALQRIHDDALELYYVALEGKDL